MIGDENFETLAIRTQSERSKQKEHSTALHLTSSYVYDNAEEMANVFSGEEAGNIYGRISNPNTSELIDKVCLMEGAESGIATATGMSAIFTSLAGLLSKDDHVLACKSIFSSTNTILSTILPKWGISYTYVDVNDTENWQNYVQENTKVVFVETPTNPGLDIIDMEWLGKFSSKNNLIFMVDNCFATPYLQQPIKYGANIVIHSATKYIDGQGRVLGGLIVGDKSLIDQIFGFSIHSGTAMSPFNAWVLSKSLETLAVRMDRHCENAMKLAETLEGHPNIEYVKYPFLDSHPNVEIAKKQMKHGGGLVSIVVKGGLEGGRSFINKLSMISISANLGDTRTIVTHPTSSTHSGLSDKEKVEQGVLPGLIRISVGLEHIDDIIEDIEQALG